MRKKWHNEMLQITLAKLDFIYQVFKIQIETRYNYCDAYIPKVGKLNDVDCWISKLYSMKE